MAAYAEDHQVVVREGDDESTMSLAAWRGAYELYSMLGATEPGMRLTGDLDDGALYANVDEFDDGVEREVVSWHRRTAEELSEVMRDLHADL